jgi:hypothetical protein
MTTPDGVPVLRDSGEPYSHKLLEGENPASIASALTKKVRRYLRDDTEAEEQFRRPLHYPKLPAWM